jgi:hypothetical protein
MLCLVARGPAAKQIGVVHYAARWCGSLGARNYCCGGKLSTKSQREPVPTVEKKPLERAC